MDAILSIPHGSSSHSDSHLWHYKKSRIYVVKIRYQVGQGLVSKASSSGLGSLEPNGKHVGISIFQLRWCKSEDGVYKVKTDAAVDASQSGLDLAIVESDAKFVVELDQAKIDMILAFISYYFSLILGHSP
ncbi:hypothetical protein Ddye_023128 [Dipteronia dyeriana]|uniref:Uncharacterized protein n=1 Tax=Dipteronia dyeriana TaxID=168575 RepID=A0AAD9TTC7_9ROSI|nr:hypothetical protein Ddye_023128 [Dipteronia dyeriana]